MVSLGMLTRRNCYINTVLGRQENFSTRIQRLRTINDSLYIHYNQIYSLALAEAQVWLTSVVLTMPSVEAYELASAAASARVHTVSSFVI